jgi:hypothetical protein
MLFAGTEHGIYISFDDGANWQSLRLDLPLVSVHDIAVKDNDVLIATHGRSFYILENISVLRQLSPEAVQSDVHMFQPPEALRSVSRGVVIDYYLKQAADKVTIEILDGRGNPVRTFTGTSSETQQKPETPAVGGEEESPRAAPARVGTKAGMNRFLWDMRYPDAAGFPKIILWAGNLRGPVALPGKYQVRLTMAGQTRTQPFTIAKHPMLTGVSDADLEQQFKLAMQIRDKLGQANESVVRIRGLKDQIADRVGKLDAAQDAEIAAGGKELARKLTAIEGEIYQYRNQSSQDPLNYPIKLNNKLAALAGVVQSADARPTNQSYEAFKDLSARLDAQLAVLEALETKDLPSFNRLLATRKLDPVTGRSVRPPGEQDR